LITLKMIQNDIFKHKINFLLKQNDSSEEICGYSNTIFGFPNSTTGENKHLKKIEDYSVKSNLPEINWNYASNKRPRTDRSFFTQNSNRIPFPTISNPFMQLPKDQKKENLEPSFSEKILPSLSFKPSQMANAPIITNRPKKLNPFFVPSNGLFHPISQNDEIFRIRPSLARVQTEKSKIEKEISEMMKVIPTGLVLSGIHQNSNRSQEELVNLCLMTLRAQTYCYVLNDAKTEPDKRFRCVFSSTCDKRIKGKGNLRRHIEWHLRRIEEEWKGNSSISSNISNVVILEQKPLRQETVECL